MAFSKSACAAMCLMNWPALKAGDADKDMGDWKVIARDDGSKQWAYKGKPLYYFARDAKAGDTTGDGRGIRGFLRDDHLQREAGEHLALGDAVALLHEEFVGYLHAE